MYYNYSEFRINLNTSCLQSVVVLALVSLVSTVLKSVPEQLHVLTCVSPVLAFCLVALIT